jgi:aminoglycoside 6'-N-acetyltransferase I
VIIREIVESDRDEWVRLRADLWPGSLADHEAETRAYFERRPQAPLIFVAEAEGRLVGFLELDYRKYAPGCSSSPVPFIEGWYVEPAVQGRGIGRALVEAAEAYARAAGHQRSPATRGRERRRHHRPPRWDTRKSSGSPASASRWSVEGRAEERVAV